MAEAEEQAEEGPNPYLLLPKCCYNATKLHFSLSVLALAEETELQRAADVLSAWFRQSTVVSALALAPWTLELLGVDSFKDEVLFTVPTQAGREWMTSVAEDLNRWLIDSDLLGEEYRFVAHATIMKTSMLLRKRLKGYDRKALKKVRIPRRAWEGFAEHRIGEHAFDKVQLLDMRKPDGEGFFKVDWECNLPKPMPT